MIEDKYNEILSEIVEVDDKDNYFASLVSNRLQENSRKYEEEFDHFLNVLLSSEVDRDNFNHTSQSIKRLASLLDDSFNNLIKIFSKISK